MGQEARRGHAADELRKDQLMTKTLRTVLAAGMAMALVAGTAAVSVAARGQAPGGGPGAWGPGPGGHGMRGPGGPGGPMGGLMRGLRGLDLSEAQRTSIRAIAEKHKAEFEAIGDRLRVAQKALMEVETAETVDESAIRAKVTERAAVEADAAVLRARVHAEVWAQLTPEQQQKARDLRAQMEQRRGQREQQMKERREQRRQQPGA
jgi:protein CpxP